MPNRHHRRAARARRRGARPGYIHRLIAARDSLPRGKVGITRVEHDTWCGVYRREECTCVPNISITIDGDDVLIIETDGSVRRVARS